MADCAEGSGCWLEHERSSAFGLTVVSTTALWPDQNTDCQKGCHALADLRINTKHCKEMLLPQAEKPNSLACKFHGDLDSAQTSFRAGNMRPSVERRVKVIAGHLLPSDQGCCGDHSQLAHHCCAAHAQQASSSYRSISGKPNSYAKVHGEVSRKPAQWEAIPSVQGEKLEDIEYHKAEGIAKASLGRSPSCCLHWLAANGGQVDLGCQHE